MPKKKRLAKPQLIRALQERDAETVGEIIKRATTPEHIEFVAELAEYFTNTEIVLVLRALDKSGLAEGREV